MAGDWIKLRTDLQTHPKVVRILSAVRPHDVQTRTDKFRVIGGLHAVWSVFDTHSSDGVLHGYTPDTLDHVIGWEGFSQGMMAVGWLDWDGAESLALPEFAEHNGQSAKRRGEDMKRKRVRRLSESCPQFVRKDDGQKADTMRTRDREREDIKENPPTPLSTDVDPSSTKAVEKSMSQQDQVSFDRFWAAWPKSPRKVGKADCLKRWVRHGLKGHADAIVAHIEAMCASQQWREGFEPAPATYLNQRRWEDGVPQDRKSDSRVTAPWWETASGIEGKAVDLNVTRKPGEDAFSFKVRVFKRAGDGKWRELLLADLLRTKSSAYANVYEFFNGNPPMENAA